MDSFLDPDLLATLDALEGSRFKGTVWRVSWASRNPLAGNAGGGRWSPEGRFDVLYASLQEDGALAEAYHHLSRAPVFSTSHTKLNEISVSLKNVLSLDSGQLTALGMEDPLASRPRDNLGPAIGEAAFMLDFQGLLVPSARWECRNLVVFLDHGAFDISKHLTLRKASDVNWPAWREKTQFD